MKKTASIIALALPIFVLLASHYQKSLPGGYVTTYVIGIVLCLPNIGFSSEWPKWIAIILLLTFCSLALNDHTEGMVYEKTLNQNGVNGIITPNQPSDPIQTPK